MGRSRRPKPKRLPEKLLQIRDSLGLSQNELIRRLNVAETITRDYLSGFESGRREPSLTVLLHYARLAGVCMAVLVDDALDLPERIPSKIKHKEL
jgi:transcriptional regulator with XRE-family HTH domain